MGNLRDREPMPEKQKAASGHGELGCSSSGKSKGSCASAGIKLKCTNLRTRLVWQAVSTLRTPSTLIASVLHPALITKSSLPGGKQRFHDRLLFSVGVDTVLRISDLPQLQIGQSPDYVNLVIILTNKV
ncbi:MAG: hypothetical protein H6Q37_1588 [Chloroflexi bacterium]|nr:hypothetical protein [Chloroflexota bacterium]